MSYETIIPLLLRRGGCAVNKMSRSHLSPRRRGGRSQANVSKRTAKRDSRATTPSAPFRNGTIFLLARPPLLTRRGMRPREQFGDSFDIAACSSPIFYRDEIDSSLSLS